MTDVPFNQVLTDKCLLDLANQLGKEWEQLATYLEFESGEMDRLKSDYSGNILTAIHRMLVKWRQRQDPDHGIKQVVESLSQALSFCQRQDLASGILEVIPKR